MNISVLCLSTGNFDGLGDVRRQDLQPKLLSTEWYSGPEVILMFGDAVYLYILSSFWSARLRWSWKLYSWRMHSSQGDGKILPTAWLLGPTLICHDLSHHQPSAGIINAWQTFRSKVSAAMHWRFWMYPSSRSAKTSPLHCLCASTT